MSTDERPPVKSKKKQFEAFPGTSSASAKRRKSAKVYSEQTIILDFVLNRILLYSQACGGGVSARKDSRGYTLFLEDGSNSPIARLRPKQGGVCYEILYWSTFRRRWEQVGPPGEFSLPLDEALDFIADDPMDCFWY